MKKVIVAITGLLVGLSLVSPQFAQANLKPQGSEGVTRISAEATEPVSTPVSTPTIFLKDPRDIAQEWLAAVADQDDDKFLSLTCAARQDELKQSSPWSLAFPSLEEWIVALEDIKIDTTKLSLAAPDPNGAEVKVEVEGRSVSIIGLELAYGHTYEWRTYVRDIEVQWWLVQEAGQWRWCGAIQGEFPPTPHPSPTPRPLRSAQSGTAASGLWGFLGSFLGIVFGLLLPLVMIISQWWVYLNKRKS